MSVVRGRRQLPGQLPGQLQQRDLEVLERRNVALPGDQYQVESLGQITLLQPKGLTQQSLQPTATNRIAVFLRNTQPEPRSTTLATDIGEDKQPPVTGSTTSGVHPLEITLVPQSPPGRKTLIGSGTGHNSMPGWMKMGLGPIRM